MTENTITAAKPELTYWHSGLECCDRAWEAAYQRFETHEQEIAKFTARLRQLGVHRLPRDSQIVELFCGRGNGLHALARLGFRKLEGVDLSPTLLTKYRGAAGLYVADCREMQFAANSRDLVIVQGGLHHLPNLPEDLELVLAEMRRILKPTGKIVVVEPWLTPFLQIVHAACERKLLRKMWGKLDALAAMIELEATTYFNWLSQPRVITDMFDRHFTCEYRRTSFGKLMYIGQKATQIDTAI